MQISFIIPVINEVGNLQQAVERAWKAGAHEVIIVDGGSDDGTWELANSLKCLALNSAPGRGIQLQAGAQVATGNVLLFLHADNWLASDACQQIRERFPEDECFWGGFQQRIGSARWIYRVLEWGNAIRVRWQGLVYGDQGIFITRGLFEKVGGFPPQPLMEDFELSRRLYRVSNPVLLRGPIHLSNRRWAKFGVVRQTILNWTLAAAYRLGASPNQLSKWYRRHDRKR